MKIAVLLAILVIGIMMPISAYAEAGEIGYKLLPEKIGRAHV